MLTKAEVNYKETPKTDKCEACDYYHYGDCDMVAGHICGDAVCDKFTPRFPKKAGKGGSGGPGGPGDGVMAIRVGGPEEAAEM